MKPHQCPKCSCQDMAFKEGISKKNGKPWRGWKCTNKACGEMVFESSYPAKTKTSVPAISGSMEKKVDEILFAVRHIQKCLGVDFTPAKDETQELTKEPVEETPF